ncbi:MAG: octaprenyl diphosphate synthase [Thiotrichales bacterium]|nr:MAG: octaprenyl diphosphate synthase [Thiotrichales bacterium]
MQLDTIKSLVIDDFVAVDQLISSNLHSEVSLINDVVSHLNSANGKRIRPLVVLLCAQIWGYQGHDQHKLAAIIEFIHTATLLHDDVIDESTLRRGQPTANATWGNSTAVLVGDFLYSRTFQLMVSLGNMQIMQILADASNIISQGEVMQLANTRNLQLSQEQYLKIIQYKTATLFEAAGNATALLTAGNQNQAANLAKYGLHLGMAFQLVDDILDYNGKTAGLLGKNIGDDLAEGKLTLPLIHTLEHGNSHAKELISAAINSRDNIHLTEIIKLVNDSGAIAATKELAQAHVTKAIAALDGFANNSYLEAAVELARFTIQRIY